jgi:hypothetical protein
MVRATCSAACANRLAKGMSEVAACRRRLHITELLIDIHQRMFYFLSRISALNLECGGADTIGVGANSCALFQERTKVQ